MFIKINNGKHIFFLKFFFIVKLLLHCWKINQLSQILCLSSCIIGDSLKIDFCIWVWMKLSLNSTSHSLLYCLEFQVCSSWYFFQFSVLKSHLFAHSSFLNWNFVVDSSLPSHHQYYFHCNIWKVGLIAYTFHRTG